jgi:phosphate transport system permease protein
MPKTAKTKVVKIQRLQDFFFHKFTLFFAVLVLIFLAGIILSLIISAWPTFKEFGFKFFISTDWDVVNSKFGMVISIYGTLISALIALIIAVPISFGIALFLTEISPNWLKRPLGTAIELLAAVPSIIYGMFGLFIFAPIFGDYIQPILQSVFGKIPIIGALFVGAPNGIGMLCAGIILAFMIIPFIASVMRDVFEIVPSVLKESAYGIGCTKWEVVSKIVFPYARNGVVGGVMLGLGRALGETMAVTFVIGNANRINASLFAPGSSIASTLANQFGEAEPGLHYSSLFALGLALFIITFVVLALAKLMLFSMEKKEGIRT